MRVPKHQCCAESHGMQLHLLKPDEVLDSGHKAQSKLAKRQGLWGALRNPSSFSLRKAKQIVIYLHSGIVFSHEEK